MLVVTTPILEGHRVTSYLGMVTGDAILGANVFKDFMATVRDVVGGRSVAYERELQKAKQHALDEMLNEAKALGANAVIGVDLDFESIRGGGGGSMLMVCAAGTAVIVEE
jgi:uncharacterized protein YbjQ (UPF0145 family)